MSRRSDLLGDDWDAITAQLANGKAQPTEPQQLAPAKIHRWPGVFQHRGRRGAEGDDHVKVLAAAVRKSRTGQLSPVTVWWDGKRWVCIDGHHRLDAYRLAAITAPIPVEVFNGSLSEAVIQAAAANTKDKLAMPTREKMNAAWRLVIVTGNAISREATAEAASVSTGSIAIMRRVRAQLESRAAPTTDALTISRVVDYRNLPWLDAKRLAEGRDAIDRDWDEADNLKVQEWATALTKLFGRTAGKRPELLARALDLYDTRVMTRMVEYWREEHGEDDDGNEAAEDDAEAMQG